MEQDSWDTINENSADYSYGDEGLKEIIKTSYKRGITNYVQYCFLYTVIAILTGLIVDILCRYIQKYLIKNGIIMIIVQILLVSIMAYIIERYLHRIFAETWQETTPGLFFVSVFFGVQFNLFINISKISDQFRTI